MVQQRMALLHFFTITDFPSPKSVLICSVRKHVA